MSNLLVVDFDFFFPNPMEGGDASDGSALLYDWGHRESPFMIHGIWPIRATGFLRNNLPLPGVLPTWRTFADRFRFSEDAQLLAADSNGYAGLLNDGGMPFEQVWLFDAHHDCGYGVDSFAEWQQRLEESGGQFSCEDWMLLHQQAGSELHYRFPTWHTAYLESGVTVPDGVLLDSAPDDGQPLDVEFDAVFVCRSGAWVPPWCDLDFEAFLDTWGLPVEPMDAEPFVRDFPSAEELLQTVQMESDLMAQALAQHNG